jgi:Zn-dependent protease
MITYALVRNPFSIGRVAGIPIRMRLSFLLLLGFVLFFAGGVGAVGVVLLTFASIVVHELGHALVARRLGVRIAAIDLHFLGGAALMVDPPRTANDEIAIAAAGPLVSLALAGLGFGLGAATGVELISMLGWVNLVLALFNLVPALPMDGGRILRAILARRLGYQRATLTAVKVSRVFAALFAVAGIAFGQLNLLLLAGLVWFLGTAEQRAARTAGYRDEPVLVDRWSDPPYRETRHIVYRW